MPKSKRASTKRKKPQKPGRAPGRSATPESKGLANDFLQAVELARTGFLFDAIKKFDEIARTDRKGEVADDALFNAGACYLKMSLHHDALAYFTRVIQGYADARIAAVPGAMEFGRTAAKAHLGRLHAYLALGKREDAAKELDALKNFDDSYVIAPDGAKKTFHQLGAEAMAT
jgi:tetratricopeptide (TPR) repeat protein